MPFDPRDVGTELIAAGQKQQSLGARLVSASTRVSNLSTALNANGRLDTAMRGIRSGVNAIRGYLGPVATALNFVVNALNGIRIPTIAFRTRRMRFPVVGAVTFVTGITVGRTTPFASIAARINTVRANVNSTRNTLAAIASALADFRREFPRIQRELRNAAADMAQGGDDIKEAGSAMEDAGRKMGGS
jgi:hypothetical protein